MRRRGRYWISLTLLVIALLLPTAHAAEPDENDPSSKADDTTVQADNATLQTVLVTARKQTENPQNIPLSLTVIDLAQLNDAGVVFVKDASWYVPNLYVANFTARKVAEPYVRGVGASPQNPGITTYIDGIPQLNTTSANIELLDIDRVEFLRGPQGTLYGRNTVGGVINIYSSRPSDIWTATASAGIGNYDYRSFRASASGPIIENKLFMSVAGGYESREGFSDNSITGNDVDNREATFGKLQFLFTPTDQTEIRYVVWGESDRDGDFALNDLAAVRDDPFTVSRDFEGFTERDIVGQSLQLKHRGEEFELNWLTGFVWWDTLDKTDLDYSPADLLVRRNDQEMWQLTQEVRLSNPDGKPVELNEHLDLTWLAGAFYYYSDMDQDAVTDTDSSLTGTGFDVRSHEEGTLRDWGLGLFGQATVTLDKQWDFTAGLRLDYEYKQADLATFTEPALPGATNSSLSESYTQVSPRFAIGYHVNEDVMLYTSVAKGYKAGGFNAVAPAGNQGYDEETSWTYELGIKSQWLEKKVLVNAALFYIDWKDMQLSTPNPAAPGRFFTDNAGSATSQGAELEVIAKLSPNWDFFGGIGYVDAEFRSGSASGGSNVGGNRLPYAPTYIANVGTQYNMKVTKDIKAFARAELFAMGDFKYDASNGAAQNDFQLVNLRVGLRHANFQIEGWMRNAFDEEYVPLAFPFPGIAPSGYLGEPGDPQTYGFTVSIFF